MTETPDYPPDDGPEEPDDAIVPFSKVEVQALIRSCRLGGEEVTEFKVRRLLAWATRVRAESRLLDALLTGHFTISKITHAVEETATFHIGPAPQ